MQPAENSQGVLLLEKVEPETKADFSWDNATVLLRSDRPFP